jgi:hypothetical protein
MLITIESSVLDENKFKLNFYRNLIQNLVNDDKIGKNLKIELNLHIVNLKDPEFFPENETSKKFIKSLANELESFI